MATENRLLRWTRLTAFVVIATMVNISFAAEATTDGEMRVSESAFHKSGGRDGSLPNRISTDAFEAGDKIGRRSTKSRSDSTQKSTSATASQTPNTDFWIYTADVELFADTDRDGYYHGIDLLFDADTYYASAEVYAVVYLSLEGGPWLEYAETENFNIFGASGEDEYVIVSELLAGYPTGSYDVLIELFDTWDNSFVADFGPENSSELAYLPLEDAERDTPVAAPTPIVVSRGGGGALDMLSLGIATLLTAGLLLRRRYRSRPVPACRRGPSA